MVRIACPPAIGDALTGARLLWSLPAWLRRPMRPEQALPMLERRFERRESDFVELIRRTVFDQPSSPYRRLLGLAGCEYGDFERFVRHEGVEGALRELFEVGVYLTVDELKGRQPVVRGSASLRFRPELFRNASARGVRLQTSGSRGPRTTVTFDVEFLRDYAVDDCLDFVARGRLWRRNAFWRTPGDALFLAIRMAAVGAGPVRWFTPVDPAAPGLDARYRWSGRAVHLASRLAGRPLPVPEFLPGDDPLPIARWMRSVLRAGETPDLTTFASSAVRVCQAAIAAGLGLEGAVFTMGSEPITPSRVATVERTGARYETAFGSAEAGNVARGCLAPMQPDEMHLLHDLHAVIRTEPPGARPGLPSGALLISSLRPAAPYRLLNVSMGDRAELGPRSCGCALERLGWSTHLHSVRSFEKLTAGGMTFLDTDLIAILEEVLPGRFGGGPTDYQLLEEEGRDGEARVRLLVHPRVGPVDLAAVADTFLAAIGGGSGAERVMELHWRGAGLFSVERQPPLATVGGKIHHLHQVRRSASIVG